MPGWHAKTLRNLNVKIGHCSGPSKASNSGPVSRRACCRVAFGADGFRRLQRPAARPAQRLQPRAQPLVDIGAHGPELSTRRSLPHLFPIGKIVIAPHQAAA